MKLTAIFLLLAGTGVAELKTETREARSDRPPKIQLRSILVRCPYKSRFNTYKETGEAPDVAISRSREVLQFYGYDVDEPLLHSEVIKCRRKLVITVKLSNCGKLRKDSEYVVVDHAYDPVSKQKARLLNPIVLKITQESMLQAYPLNVEHIVNAEATEEVISKETSSSYVGCDVCSNNPTCGRAYYSGKAIPFSEGFCCSCDLYENVKRQPIAFRADTPEPDTPFCANDGVFPQPLSTHRNVSAKKCLHRDADRELNNLLKEFDKSDEKTRAAGFLNFLENRNTSFVDVERLKRFYYPSFKGDYYPHMDPANGNKLQGVPKGAVHWEMTSSRNLSKYYYDVESQENFRDERLGTNYTGRRGRMRRQTSKSEDLKQHENTAINNKAIPKLMDDSPINDATKENFTHPEHKTSRQHNNSKNKEFADENEVAINNKEVRSSILSKVPHETDGSGIKSEKETMNTDLTTQLNELNDKITQTLQEANERIKQSLIASSMKNGESGIRTEINLQEEGNIRSTKINRTLKNDRSRRQITSSGTQRRGGQDCIDRTTPIYANPVTYHESTHCLRFSDLWYTAYKFKEPFIAHTVSFEMYEKHCLEGVKNKWEIITNGFKAEVGTFVRRVRNRDTTVVFSYTPFTSLDKDHFCLRPGAVLLLVPRALPKEKLEEFPQPSEPSGKYLLVRPQDITYDGDDCDKAGVSYSAFFKQPDRCNHPKGTCLKNQPLQMWRSDTERKARGEKGRYFLENYVSVPDQALKVVDDRQFLTLDYEGKYESIVEIEVKADGNGILRKESTVQISEMYVDSTCEFHTKITISVTNTGLVSSLFRPRMTNCPVSIPTVWFQKEGPLVAIAPQRKHVYRLSLYGRIPASRFHCSVEILSQNRRIMATRRIRIQIFDRCICMWHCLCACTGGLRGLECQPMSIEHFHAAGFVGSMPITTNEKASDDTNYTFLVAIGKLLPTAVFIHIFLLIFGLCKALIGLCCSRTVAILHLHLVCPALVRQLETLDPILSKNIRVGDIPHGFHTHCLLKMLEFFYNVICFLVIPGWCLIYFILGIIRGCMQCLVYVDKSKKKRKNKRNKKYTMNKSYE